MMSLIRYTPSISQQNDRTWDQCTMVERLVHGQKTAQINGSFLCWVAGHVGGGHTEQYWGPTYSQSMYW